MWWFAALVQKDKNIQIQLQVHVAAKIKETPTESDMLVNELVVPIWQLLTVSERPNSMMDVALTHYFRDQT